MLLTFVLKRFNLTEQFVFLLSSIVARFLFGGLRLGQGEPAILLHRIPVLTPQICSRKIPIEYICTLR